MALTGKNLWQKVSLVHPSSEIDRSEGLALFREYTHRGYLNAAQVEKGGLRDGVVLDFFRRLSLLRTSSSPVCRRRDARWMSSSDFQFYQIRDAGSFFRAAADLPFLRTDAVILLPVTRIQPGYPLYPVSHSLLDPDLSEPLLDSSGFSLEEQFRLFLSAAHLTGLKVGYYLSPLIAPDSAVIYRKPEFFLWKRRGNQPDPPEDPAAEVRRITAKEFEETRSYDYSRIRRQVNDASLAAVSVPPREETVCFNLDNRECREYFADIFLNLQNRYALDFLFLSLPEEMTPDNAARTVDLVQSPEKGRLKKYTGWIVDHPIADYEETFQTVTNLFSSRAAYPSPLGVEEFHLWFHRLGDLHGINQGRSIPYSRTVPLLWDRLDAPEVLRLYFLTRFSGISRCRRPLLIDQGYARDPEFLSVQNRIEDVYTRYTDVLNKGRLLKVVADETYAWWIIRDRGRILIPLISLDLPETEEEAASGIRIDYSPFISRTKLFTVVEYDFSSPQGSLYLSADNSLQVEDLKQGSFRLFSLQ